LLGWRECDTVLAYSANWKLLFFIAFENHYKSNNSNNYPDKSKWEIA